jgi:hypothetical protein
MMALVLGIVLVIVALILGVIQIYYLWGINFYGASANKWYFYGAVAAIGIVGIILALWGIVTKGVPKQTIT